MLQHVALVPGSEHSEQETERGEEIFEPTAPSNIRSYRERTFADFIDGLSVSTEPSPSTAYEDDSELMQNLRER